MSDGLTALLFVVTLLGYGAVTGLFAASLSLSRTVLPGWPSRTLLGAFGMHTLVAASAILGLGAADAGARVWDHAFVTLAWGLMAVVIALGFWRPKTRVLGAFLAPVALGLCLAAVLAPRSAQVVAFLPDGPGPAWLPIHLSANIGSMALFALAFGAGLAYLLQDARLKKKRIAGGGGVRLPPLEVLGGLVHSGFGAGLACLSLVIVSGAFLAVADDVDGDQFRPKVIATLALWLFYALGWQARHLLGWRGRKAAWIAILGFLGFLALVGLLFV
ncbi:MAG: hypothetical protein CL928_04195 [Deltaproteobacteria bacterium]|nr:hypothetical protein [Deltaproteobacteria bacterium]